MTVRDELNRRKRKAGIIAYSGLAILIISVLALGGGHGISPFALAGFAVFAGGILYLLWGVRCPTCRGAIGLVTSNLSSPFSISRQVKFCPFCGVVLDSELRKEQ